MSNSRLVFQQVSKHFVSQKTTVAAVSDVSLTINDGEVVSLIGPSGCGKSTLLNMGSGLYRPSSGEVYVDGELVRKPNAHVAFMLQKDLLLPWRTISENVEFGLQILGRGRDERRSEAMKWLQQCRLSDFAGHYPHQLSGGMRQRAALARTLAVNPSVLLLDEPFSALDAQTKMVLQQDLAQMLAQQQKTSLFITHDLFEAVILSDRVLVMSARPGRIIEEITVDLPDRDNANARRRNPALGNYIPHLMELLHIGETPLLPPPHLARGRELKSPPC